MMQNRKLPDGRTPLVALQAQLALLEQAVTRTLQRRPDLVAKGELAKGALGSEASRVLQEFLAARAPGTEDRG